MPGAQPRQSPQARQGKSVVRGTRASAPGAHRVARNGGASGPASSDVWVVVEAEAEIAAKGHPYISFDPAGSF